MRIRLPATVACRRLLILAGLALLAGGAVRAEIEFAGYARTGEGERFLLADPAKKETSDWLGVGGSFDGFTITAFDAKAEMLTVEKAGMTKRLALKSATVRPPPPGPGESTQRYKMSSNTPTRVVAATEAREKAAQELLAQRHRTLDRRARARVAAQLDAEEAALRQRHPEGHPELTEVRRKRAELEPQLARDRVDQFQESRASLLKQIQDPATAPAQAIEARRALDALEKEMARENAGVAK